MIARTITRKVSPQTFRNHAVADNRNYNDLLRDMMDYMNDGRGISVILTPGRYNSAFSNIRIWPRRREPYLLFRVT